MAKKTTKTQAFFAKIKKFIQKHKKNDTEYSKRMLTKITNHCLLMMWGTYILAWFDKDDIAESLSKTVASAIIGVVVTYLVKSLVENINKYKTTSVKGKIVSYQDDEDSIDDDNINKYRDC